MKATAPLFLIPVWALILSASGALAQTAAPEPHIDTVEVTGAKDIDKAVNSFVKSYAKPTPLLGKIARWSAQFPICPQATGLEATYNVFVSERIRTVAGMVGAPVETKAPCTPNMVVVFTPHPQALLDAIRTDRTDLLGYHYLAQLGAMTKVSHPVQAWYATATRDDNGILTADDAQAFDECMQENDKGNNKNGGVDATGLVQCRGASRGTRVLDGMHSEIATITVVVDNSEIVGLPIGAVADYVAMLALSQTQAFETCQPLPSITNLMTAGCGSQKAQTLAETDIAYLKALYKMNPDVFLARQQSDIAHQMEAALRGPAP